MPLNPARQATRSLKARISALELRVNTPGWEFRTFDDSLYAVHSETGTRVLIAESPRMEP